MWEAARREQYILRYELKMDELKKTLNDHCVRETNENHVNDVLTRYLTRRIAVRVNSFSTSFCLKRAKMSYRHLLPFT